MQMSTKESQQRVYGNKWDESWWYLIQNQMIQSTHLAAAAATSRLLILFKLVLQLCNAVYLSLYEIHNILSWILRIAAQHDSLRKQLLQEICCDDH